MGFNHFSGVVVARVPSCDPCRNLGRSWPNPYPMQPEMTRNARVGSRSPAVTLHTIISARPIISLVSNMTSQQNDLDVRLRKVPEQILRQIIQSVCLQDSSVEKLVLRQLDRYDAVRPTTTAQKAHPSYGVVSAAGHTAEKRKADDSATLVCANCKNIYSSAEDSDTACSYHTGKFICLMLAAWTYSNICFRDSRLGRGILPR